MAKTNEFDGGFLLDTLSAYDGEHIRQCSECSGELKSGECRAIPQNTQHGNITYISCKHDNCSCNFHHHGSPASDSIKFSSTITASLLGSIPRIMQWQVNEWNSLERAYQVLHALKVNVYIVRPNNFLSANLHVDFPRLNMDSIFESIDTQEVPAWSKVESALHPLLEAFSFDGCKNLVNLVDNEESIDLLKRLRTRLERANSVMDEVCHVRHAVQLLLAQLTNNRPGHLLEHLSAEYFNALFCFFDRATEDAHFCLRVRSKEPLTLNFGRNSARQVEVDFRATTMEKPFLIGQFKSFPLADKVGPNEYRQLMADLEHLSEEQPGSSSSSKRKGACLLQAGDNVVTHPLKKTKLLDVEALTKDVLSSQAGSGGDAEKSDGTPEGGNDAGISCGEPHDGDDAKKSDGKPDDGEDAGICYDKPDCCNCKEPCGYRKIKMIELHKVKRYLPQLLGGMLASLDANGDFHASSDPINHKDTKRKYATQLGFAVEGFKLRFVRLVLCQTKPSCFNPTVKDLINPEVRCQVFVTKEINLFDVQHLKLLFKYLYSLAYLAKFK